MAEPEETSEEQEPVKKPKKEKIIYKDPNPLPSPLNEMRKEYKTMYMGKESLENMHNFLVSEVFEKLENPYDGVIRMITKLPDYKLAKYTGCCSNFLKEFAEWLDTRENKDDFFKKCVNLELQLEAFKIGILNSGHTFFLKRVSHIFRLKQSGLGPNFIADIRTMLYNSRFNNAAECISHFELHDNFETNDIIEPLILQDKESIVRTYVADRTDLQIKYIEYMDDLIGMNDENLRTFLNSKVGIPNIRKERFQGKGLEKTVAKLLKQYNVPETHAPNLQLSRAKKSLNYVVYKRYSEQSLNAANFHDYIEDALENDPKLASFVVSRLAAYNECDEAIKWMKQFGVDYYSIPHKLRQYIDSNPTVVDEQEFNGLSIDCEESLVPEGYGILSPSLLENVQIVDSKELLNGFLGFLKESIAKSDNLLIGLDSEWRPLYLSTTEKVAILQVAIGVKIYLIDIIALEKVLNIDEWKDFFTQLLCGDDCIKLGFDFNGDIRCLISTVPECSELLQTKTKNVVCLSAFVKQLYRQNPAILDGLDVLTGRKVEHVENLTHPVILGLQKTVQSAGIAQTSTSEHNVSDSVVSAEDSIPDSPDASFHGNDERDFKEKDQCNGEENVTSGVHTIHFKLSDLYYFFMGKPLDKSEQFGNWAKRPLRRAQVHYAAMDAYCQLEIFDQIKIKAKELSLDFDKALEEAKKGQGKSREKGKPRIRTRLDHETFMAAIKQLNEVTLSEGCEMHSVRDFKFIVDGSHMGALAKHLRKCGIDTVIVGTHNRSVTNVKEIALAEDRIVLSTGKCYLEFIRHLTPDKVVCVPFEVSQKSADQYLCWVLHHFNIAVQEGDVFSICMKCNTRDWVFMSSEYMQILWDALIGPKVTPYNDEDNPPIPFDRYAAAAKVVNIPPNFHTTQGATLNTVVSVSCRDRWLVEFDDKAKVDMFSGEIFDLNSEFIGTTVRIDCLEYAHNVMANYDMFYVCKGCGKIFYDGSHYRQYKSFVDKTNENMPEK